MRIRINRLLEPRIQASCISKQEPQLWIVGRGLCRTLSIFESMYLIAALQSLLRGPAQSGVFDVRAPSKIGFLPLRLLLCWF